jgi:drug/metabolite transporter superfamily protein YnfA
MPADDRSRVIHQIWMQGYSEIPPKFDAYRETWKCCNSNYTFMTWSERDLNRLISEMYPHYLSFFQSLPRLVQKADVGRMFVLDAYGGIYADMDSACIQPIDALVDTFPREHLVVGRVGRVLNNAVIFSSRGNPAILGHILPEMKRRFSLPLCSIMDRLSGGWAVSFTTGPFLWHWVERNRDLFPQSGFQVVDEHVLYPRAQVSLSPGGDGRGCASSLLKNAQTLAGAGSFCYHDFANDWVDTVWEKNLAHWVLRGNWKKGLPTLVIVMVIVALTLHRKRK